MNEPALPTPNSQICDECGKTVAKIWRIHKGHKYCGTCYKRVFKRRLCLKCGNFARLPKTSPDAICIKCQMEKPCTRCGKTDYKVGKITPYGPACNACSPYFREPKPCGICGTPSIWLTRVSRLGHDYRICQTCARADHATCTACHRYRLLEQGPDGKMLCKNCLKRGETSCPKCSQSMPGGRGKQCEACYWRKLLGKRIALNSVAISAPQLAVHFRVFAEWLSKEVGVNKAAYTLHRYLSFFLDIEKQWETIPAYGALLSHFGALYLRRLLLPMRWMQQDGLLVLDTRAKEEDSERRRIIAIFNKITSGSREKAILDGYYGELLADLKNEKTSLRSIRLAITPASALLLKGLEMEQMPPDQKVLNTYLNKTPGQRAGVSGFVRYLRDHHKITIALPKLDVYGAQRNQKKKLESKLLALMQEKIRKKFFLRRWIAIALPYFHGIPQKRNIIVNEEQLDLVQGGVMVTWQNRRYWLPLPPKYSF